MFRAARTMAVVLTAGLAWLASVSEARVEEPSPILQKISQSGTFTIGYRDGVIPFSYLDADQQPIGFALDLCGLVAEKVREQFGLSGIRIDYKPVPPETRAAMLESGEVDLDCSLLPKTAELIRDATTSIPIYVAEFRWLTPRQIRVERQEDGRTRSETKTPDTADDLLGKPVALTQGSKAGPLVLSLSVDRFLGLSLLYAKDAAAAFKLVETGQAAAVIDEDVTLLALKAAAKNPDGFGFLNDAFPATSFVLAMRKDDKRFEELVNGVLADAMRSGAYAELYAKWFQSPIPPKNVNLAYAMPETVRRLVKDPPFTD